MVDHVGRRLVALIIAQLVHANNALLLLLL